MPEYHKRGSRNTTHMLFQNPKNRRTFAASIRTNSIMSFKENINLISGRHIDINE